MNDNAAPPENPADARKHLRIPARWKVALVKDHQSGEIYHGLTNEVSPEGMSIISDHNIYTDDDITLLLALPPLHPGKKEKIIEVQGRMVYTVHCSSGKGFRIGVRFGHFKRDGAKFLRQYLEKRVQGE